MNIPVYILADTQTILFEKERSIKFYPAEVSEVYKSKDKYIHVFNRYHEKIPFDPIYKVICEDGIFEKRNLLTGF